MSIQLIQSMMQCPTLRNNYGSRLCPISPHLKYFVSPRWIDDYLLTANAYYKSTANTIGEYEAVLLKIN